MNLSGIRVNKRIAYGVAVLFFLILCSSSYLILTKYNVKKIRQNSSMVAYAFGTSLETNNQTKALALTATEKHTEIKTWIQEHKEVNCPLSLESFEDDRRYISITYDSETTRHYVYGTERACPDHANWHSFKIHDIVVEMQEGGWIVVDWGEIEERLY